MQLRQKQECDKTNNQNTTAKCAIDDCENDLFNPLNQTQLNLINNYSLQNIKTVNDCHLVSKCIVYFIVQKIFNIMC